MLSKGVDYTIDFKDEIDVKKDLSGMFDCEEIVGSKKFSILNDEDFISCITQPKSVNDNVKISNKWTSEDESVKCNNDNRGQTSEKKISCSKQQTKQNKQRLEEERERTPNNHDME